MFILQQQGTRRPKFTEFSTENFLKNVHLEYREDKKHRGIVARYILGAGLTESVLCLGYGLAGRRNVAQSPLF